MPETPLVTPVDPKTLDTKPVSDTSPNSKPLVLFIIVIIAGLITGFLLSSKSKVSSNSNQTGSKAILNTDTEVGSTDTKTFRDTASGVLEAGGSNGEGTHKLIRDGGPSQTVYLISSIVDLEEFAGKKVQVWGETIRAQKVGWLMDVGRVKLVE